MKKNRFIAISLSLICLTATMAACKEKNPGSSSSNTPPEVINPADYAGSPYVGDTLSFEQAKDSNGNTLMLTTKGTSSYKIVTAEAATMYDKLAAQDLQLFLEEASGCKLPIVSDATVEYGVTDYYISVGTTALYTALAEDKGIVADYEELNEDGSLLHLEGNAIYLTGAAGYGTLNAVYRFLEYEVGYEAYALDEIFVEKKVDVPVLKFNDTTIKSKSVYRDIQHGRVFSSSQASEAARMGLISSASGGSTLEGRLWALFIHSFKTLVPQASAPTGWWNNGQLCLTNDDIVAVVAEGSKKYMLQYPSARYIMYGGEDDSKTCNCGNCAAEAAKYGGHGALLLKFVNKVSVALDDWMKENDREHVTLMALNYLGYESSPSYFDATTGKYVPYDETCIARDNVGTFLCFPSADYGHSLDDPTSSTNKIEYEKLKGWAACTDNIGVYLYLADYYNYFQYYNAVSVYQGWMRTLQEYGVDLYFLHNIGENVWSPFGDLKLYLLSKLSADATEFSQEELTQDFMKHYYKDAAEEMYAFYNKMVMHYTLISANHSNNQKVDCYGTMPNYGDAMWYPLAVLEEFLDIVDQAYQKIDNSVLEEEIKDKVRLRISSEEFIMRYYRYQGYNDIMTEEDRLAEASYLNAKVKELGITCTGENKPWSDL